MKVRLFKLENWFLATLFGIVFASLVPANQVTDNKYRHFARIYAILDDNLTSQKRWMFFRFPAVQDVTDHKFALTFTPEGNDPGDAVTIRVTRSDLYPGGEMLGD